MAALVGSQRGRGNPKAPFVRYGSYPGKANCFCLGEWFHEPVFDPALSPLGERRLIGRGERGDGRETERAQQEPRERFHDGSFQAVGQRHGSTERNERK